MAGHLHRLQLQHVKPIKCRGRIDSAQLLELPQHQLGENLDARRWKRDRRDCVPAAGMVDQGIVELRCGRKPLEMPQQASQARAGFRHEWRADVAPAHWPERRPEPGDPRLQTTAVERQCRRVVELVLAKDRQGSYTQRVRRNCCGPAGQVVRQRPATLDNQGKRRRLMSQFDRAVHQHAFPVQSLDQIPRGRARRVVQTGQQILARAPAVAAREQARQPGLHSTAIYRVAMILAGHQAHHIGLGHHRIGQRQPRSGCSIRHGTHGILEWRSPIRSGRFVPRDTGDEIIDGSLPGMR